MLNREARSTVNKYSGLFLPKRQFCFLLWSPAGRGPGEATNHWSPGSSCSITDLKVLQSALITLCKAQQRFRDPTGECQRSASCGQIKNPHPPTPIPMAVVYQSGFSLCCPDIPINCWSCLDNLHYKWNQWFQAKRERLKYFILIPKWNK